MRIDSISSLMARTILGGLPKAAPAFRAAEGEVNPTPPVQPVNGGNPLFSPSVQMLVAMAATNPEVERRRKQAEHATRGVDVLERLHKELVSGAPGVVRLQEIVEWAQGMETPDDPVLASLLAEIDLRVRVELAKMDVQV